MYISRQDILSYSREQATGLGSFNYLTIVMHAFSLDRDGATQWLFSRVGALERKYMTLVQRLDELGIGPSHGGQLQEYFTHVANLRRGHYDWGFECGRYFGARGGEYGETRRVPLIPEQQRDKNLTQDKVEVMLIEEEYERLVGPAQAAPSEEKSL